MKVEVREHSKGNLALTEMVKVFSDSGNIWLLQGLHVCYLCWLSPVINALVSYGCSIQVPHTGQLKHRCVTSQFGRPEVQKQGGRRVGSF